tara:strand:+ start:90 stop:1013 length:924 start_codon:yes stop_codon:yes gene_type:complete
MPKQNRRKTRKMKGGGGTFSSVKKSSPETSHKGSPESNKKTTSFNNTVRKRKSYEDRYAEDNTSDNSEEEDISDKHTPKRKKKTPVKWSKKITSKNKMILTNLKKKKIIERERAHAENWDNYSRKIIDRQEHERRQKEINSPMFIGGRKMRKTRKTKKNRRNMSGGEDNNILFFVIWLGKFFILHPIAKYILFRRYGISTERWCSFPVWKLAIAIINECRGHSNVNINQVAVDNGTESAIDIEAQAFAGATDATNDITQKEIDKVYAVAEKAAVSNDEERAQFKKLVKMECPNSSSSGGRKMRKMRK